MRYQRKATAVQRIMVILMAIAAGALLLWTIPEMIGAFSPAAEDTYSEWVWDQSLPVILAIVAFHGLAGVLLIWSAGHFLEGYRRRRKQETD